MSIIDRASEAVTGLSAKAWIGIGIAAAFAVLVAWWWIRGNEIDDLRTALASERAAHEITRNSVTTLTNEVKAQNAEIDAQRAQIEQGKTELAAANAASATSQDVIAALNASSRAPRTGTCEPSAAVRKIWR